MAFLANAFDPRVRSGIEIADRLGLPLLGRVTKPPVRLRWQGRLLRLRQEIERFGRGRRRVTPAALDPPEELIMLAQPNGPHAEPFRMLRTNLEFFNLRFGSQLIMLTSATPEEGKSSVSANLAVAIARTGRRVILADLDMRRPSFEQMFDLEGHPGLADVVTGRLHRTERTPDRPAFVLGQVYLADALHPVDVGAWATSVRIPTAQAPTTVPPSTCCPRDRPRPTSASSLRAASWRPSLPASRSRQTSSLLGSSDGLALSAHVDALAVVARADEGLAPPVLNELRRVLGICKCHKLGVILTNVPPDELYRDSISGDGTAAASLRRGERPDLAAASRS